MSKEEFLRLGRGTESHYGQRQDKRHASTSVRVTAGFKIPWAYHTSTFGLKFRRRRYIMTKFDIFWKNSRIRRNSDNNFIFGFDEEGISNEIYFFLKKSARVRRNFDDHGHYLKKKEHNSFAQSIPRKLSWLLATLRASFIDLWQPCVQAWSTSAALRAIS